MKNKALLLGMLLCVGLAFFILLGVYLSSQAQIKVSTRSEVQSVPIAVTDEGSLWRVVETLSLDETGAYNRSNESSEPISKIQVILKNEKQDFITKFGGDQSDENYFASSSYAISGDTMEIYVHLNLQSEFYQEYKNVWLNEQIMRMLLMSADKNIQGIDYSASGSTKLINSLSKKADGSIDYPITFVEQ